MPRDIKIAMIFFPVFVARGMPKYRRIGGFRRRGVKPTLENPIEVTLAIKYARLSCSLYEGETTMRPVEVTTRRSS